jgi:hypothetical protein
MKYFIVLISKVLLLAGMGLITVFTLSRADTPADGDGFSSGRVASIQKPAGQEFKRVSVQHGLIAAEEDLPEVFSWSDAKVSCDTLKTNGYNDWYLPDKDELNKLFVSKKTLGGFSETQYWNSTQNDEQHAWAQDFLAGNQNSCSKAIILHVRPVRKF